MRRCVLDAGGAELARHTERRRRRRTEQTERDRGGDRRQREGAGQVSVFTPAAPELIDRALAVPVSGRRDASPIAWLVVVSEGGSLGPFERLIARQAAMVVGLELMRERVVRETERRLAGDLLSEALSGRLDPDEAAGRLRPFGIGDDAAVLVFEVDDPQGAEASVESRLAELGTGGLVATTSAAGRPLLCAVVGTENGSPIEIAGSVRETLLAHQGPVRAAVSRPAGVGSLRRAFHEARCALEATSLSNGEAPDVASHDDLGAFTLLLALQDDDALRAYSDGLLEPIERTEGEYGGELLRSLEAFIENNGNWERAARRLYCHRHTLRYRIRKIEELTGRDLGRATDRIELWLALRARELVRVGCQLRSAVLESPGGTPSPPPSSATSPSPTRSTELVLLDLDAERAGAVAETHGGGKATAARVDATAQDGSLPGALAGLRGARQLGLLPDQPGRDARLSRGALPLHRPRRALLDDRAAARARPASSPRRA